MLKNSACPFRYQEVGQTAEQKAGKGDDFCPRDDAQVTGYEPRPHPVTHGNSVS